MEKNVLMAKKAQPMSAEQQAESHARNIRRLTAAGHPIMGEVKQADPSRNRFSDKVIGFMVGKSYDKPIREAKVEAKYKVGMLV